MRTFRNISFVLLCFALLQADGAVSADCSSNPSLLGTGSTESLALQACHADAEADCPGLCATACMTQEWIRDTCTAIGGGTSWSAFGACECCGEV